MIQLLAQMIDLQTTIEQLTAIVDTRNNMVMTALRNAQKSLEQLKALVAKFEDDATMRWLVRYRYYGPELHTPLTSVEGYIRALRLGGFGTLPQSHSVLIEKAAQDVEQIVETIDSYSGETADETAAPPAHLPAEEALAPLWPILRALLFASQFNIACSPSTQPIVYHPVKITTILIALCFDLTEPPRIDEMDEIFGIGRWDEIIESTAPPQRIFHIDAQPADDAFAIFLRVEGLRMTPRVWERSLDSYWLEDLYELGGYLMPLAWDEGKGQGIVMKLPWAI